MTREEIVEAIQNDNMMPFLQDWEARDVVDFVLKNTRQELPEGLEEAAEKASKTWRRNEDGSESKELFPQTFIRGFIAGAKWDRAKMMEKAVGGKYMKADGKVYVESWLLDIDPDSVKAGDEVRLIVIPEKSEKVK